MKRWRPFFPNLIVIALVFCVHNFSWSQRDYTVTSQPTALHVHDLQNIFQQKFRQDSIYILEINQELVLHLRLRKTDAYNNSGEVKVFDVVNFATSEFLLGRIGNHYYATFTRNSWHNHLYAALDGNLVWMQELWTVPFCGADEEAVHSAFPQNAFPSFNSKLKNSETDSLNLLLIFNQSGRERVEQQLNMVGDTALFMWSNVAVSYLNLTLENSGLPGFCRLKKIEQVNSEPASLNHAFGEISTLSGNLAYIKQVMEDHCIQIRSFLMDYPGFGPSGFGNIFRQNVTSLYNSSIISYSTFCHEVGHNLGFGHGPNAGDHTGYNSNAKGYSTAHDGIAGNNLSTLMDYNNRIFCFSNLIQPYIGEFQEHHGRFLGREDRNNAGSIASSYPYLQIIHSKRVYLDTLVCQGVEVFGYSEEGRYIDTIADPSSCTGLLIRTLDLKIAPPIESNFDEAKQVLSYGKDEVFHGHNIFTSRVLGGDLWMSTQNHFYKFTPKNLKFSKIVSFPHPELGDTSEFGGVFEIALDIGYLNDNLIVRSNLSTYEYDPANHKWIDRQWPNLPIQNEITGTLILFDEDQVFRSTDVGQSWEPIDIPFESGPNGVSIRSIRSIDNLWFIMQLAPFKLYVSKDDGISWTKSITPFIPSIESIFKVHDKLYITPTNAFDYYVSDDQGRTWQKDPLLGNQFLNIFYSEAKEAFLMQTQGKDLYMLKKWDTEPIYLTRTNEYINRIYNQYMVLPNDGVDLIDWGAVDRLFREVTICEGGEYNGLTESGYYLMHKKEDMHCDSIILVALTVENITTAFININVCYGDIYMGHSQSGTYTLDLMDNNGCDSLVVINLTVFDSLKFDVDILHDDGNQSGEISIENITGGLPPYELSWSNGDMGEKISNLPAGYYNLEIIDQLGCIYYYLLEVELATSTQNESDDPLPHILPNPSKTSSPVQLNMFRNAFQEYRILNTAGQVIQPWQFIPSEVYSPAVPGIYLIQFRAADRRATIKWVVID